MKNLLYKEFKVSIYPQTLFFLLCGALLLIPSWPFFIAFGYLFISFMNLFSFARANNDLLFTMSLPVRKRDTVLARTCSIAILELLQIAVSVPFAIINSICYTQGNMAGMNTNFAFFGFVFIIYAIFNIIFLPGFYKTAYKFGIPMMLAILAAIGFGLGVELAVGMIPELKASIGGLGASRIGNQLPVLFGGIILFTLLTLIAYRVSAKRFEKVDV
jgi:hypothetical protein